MGAPGVWEEWGGGRGAVGGRVVGAAEVQAVEVQDRPRWETEWTGCFSWPHQAVGTMLSMKSRRSGCGGYWLVDLLKDILGGQMMGLRAHGHCVLWILLFLVFR